MSRYHEPMPKADTLPATREAAVLFAAKFAGAAERLLRSHLEGQPDDPVAWMMLLELLHFTGKRQEFDESAQAFSTAFGRPAPAWGFPEPVRSSGTFELVGTIAANANLEGLVPHARARSTVAIDMSRVVRIEFAFAATLREALRLFHHQGKRVILANIAEIHAALLESLGPMDYLVLLRRSRGEYLAIAA